MNGCGSHVLSREEAVSKSDKPLLSAFWAGAVDTVGGSTLATIVRETKPTGVVSACGLVGGTDLPLTVHPFILRGVLLAGIGSSLLPYDRRLEIWANLESRVAAGRPRRTDDDRWLTDLEAYIQRISKARSSAEPSFPLGSILRKNVRTF